jgi:hypothetical protein
MMGENSEKGWRCNWRRVSAAEMVDEPPVAPGDRFIIYVTISIGGVGGCDQPGRTIERYPPSNRVQKERWGAA